jgi:argininosuccinate lyase
MPQKKNPDVCELLRGKSAKAIGSLMAALAVLKGLPGSYNRDLQETKSILFGQVRETLESLDAFRLVVGSTEFQSVSREWQRTPQFICSTDLVEFLVKKGWRFRTAYETVASCVLMAKNDIGVFVQLCAQKTKIPHDVVSRILTPEYSVGTKASYGSTGIRPVRSTLARAKTILLENANSLPSEETNKTIIKK